MNATVPVLLAATLAAPSVGLAHDFVAAASLSSKHVAIQFKDGRMTLIMFYDPEALDRSREGNDPRRRAQLYELDVQVLMNTPPNVMNAVLVKRPSRSRTSRPYTLFTRDAYSTGGVDFEASRGVQGSGEMDMKPRDIPLATYLSLLSLGRSGGGPVRDDQIYVLITEGAPPSDLQLEPIELLADWLVVTSADQKEGSPPECFRRRDMVDPRTSESTAGLDAKTPLYFLEKKDLKHVGDAKITRYSARPSGRLLRARAPPRHYAEYKVLNPGGKETEVQDILSLDQATKDAGAPERLFARVEFLEPASALPTVVEPPLTQPDPLPALDAPENQNLHLLPDSVRYRTRKKQ